MTRAELTKIHGIGETTATKLLADGVQTKAQLREALTTLAPPASHVYSTHHATVLAALDLPTIRPHAASVAQYTQQTWSDDEIRYVWDRGPTTRVLELQREGARFRVTLRTGTGRRLQSETYATRDAALGTMTRWAYQPPADEDA